MPELNCPYRINERDCSGETVATCGLIQQLTKVADEQVATVHVDACRACVAATPVASRFINSVFPSILHSVCDDLLERSKDNPSAIASEVTQRIVTLHQMTEQSLVQDACMLPLPAPSCDVVVYCIDSADTTRSAVESLIGQVDATVYIHLVIADQAAEDLAETFRDVWNVQSHRLVDCQRLSDAVQQIVPLMRCDFFALQHPNAISLPNRIANSVSEMHRRSSDVTGSTVMAEDGVVVDQGHSPRPDADTTAQQPAWPTIVIRRSAFIDVGGFAKDDLHDQNHNHNGEQLSDEDHRHEKVDHQVNELVWRMRQSGLRIHQLPFSQVKMKPVDASSRVSVRVSVRDFPDEGDYESLKDRSIGFAHRSIACDVVVPIFGQLNYVAEAIESVIDQDNAEAIVHLVDDCGPENTDSLFRRWGTHPRVRLYRNRQNLGQYASFNNVSEFFETDFAAVQDGDDISLPHRFSTSGNLLRLTDADFFAAAMQQFGEDAESRRIAELRPLRYSRNPRGPNAGYFAMNPTAFFRVAMFRRLGGYTNYGAPESNRAGLDSEFMTRAVYAGVRFAISRSVVTRYRVHAQAATKNQETGFGTPRRQAATNECRRREQIYATARFNPRAFGAIRRYQGVTERII